MGKIFLQITTLAILFLLYSFTAGAQNLDTTLARYVAGYQQEKVYLHYDKAAYYPGETIWFKAYLMEDLLPASKSKTLYVDWIGANGTLLLHTVSPVVDGGTNGQFEIPANYTGNGIHVRAYTKWMLNFDTAFLYSRDIRILPKAAATAKPVKPASIPSIQFFPEGGDGVAGITNKIAFKATDQWGRPLRVKGFVLDNRGTVLDSFRSVHDGMGFFHLLPKEGVTYTAKWREEKGSEKTTTLPPFKPSGLAIQVNSSGTRRLVDIITGNPVPAHLKQVHLIGTMNQHTVFKTDADLTSGKAVRKVIPTEQLPTGILTITVFDAGWNAVAERITFIKNGDYSFQTGLNVQHWGLNKRARNEIQLTIPEGMQPANLSVSITDAAIEQDSSNNIISHFLLSSDIRGRVHHPAYYFAGSHDSIAQHLDLVMLTHGWRRFKWEEVVKGQLPVIKYPRDTAHLALSGKVYGVAKSQLSGNDNIMLLVKGKDTGTRMLFMPVRPNGTFSDPDLVFFDTLQVYYQLKSKLFSTAEASFMTDRLPAPDYTAMSKSFVVLPPLEDTSGFNRHTRLGAEALRLRELQNTRVLENITITAKTKPAVQVLDEKYASGLFRSGDSYQFDLVNDAMSNSYRDIFSYLQGRVAGLQITGNTASPNLSWRGGTPQLYLDEMLMDANMISSIPVTDIAYVKVFRPPFFGGVGGGGGSGAIAIYTRRGNDAKSTPGKGLSSHTIAGYSPVRQFYSPNYNTFDPRNEQPDLRTTLYWNPQVTVSPGKKGITLSFYNNDVTKAFRVVVEGMTKDGLLTHYEQLME